MPSDPDVVELLLTQHARIEELFREVLAVGGEQRRDRFEERLLLLRDAVLMHAKREERYEFQHLRHALDEATGRRLAGAVRAAEAFAPTRPHPGVESAAANLIAGPALAVAVADRVRDAVRAAMRNDGNQLARTAADVRPMAVVAHGWHDGAHDAC